MNKKYSLNNFDYKVFLDNHLSLVCVYLVTILFIVFDINPSFMDNDDADMLAISLGLNGLTSEGLIYFQNEFLKYFYQVINFVPGIKGYWLLVIILHFFTFKTYDQFLKLKTSLNTLQRIVLNLILHLPLVISSQFSLYTGVIFTLFLLNEEMHPGRKRNYIYLLLSFLMRNNLFFMYVVVFLFPKIIFNFKKITKKSLIMPAVLIFFVVAFTSFGHLEKKKIPSNESLMKHGLISYMMLDYAGFHRLRDYYDYLRLPVSKNDMNLLAHHFWFDEDLEKNMFTTEMMKLSGVPTGIRPWKARAFLNSFKDVQIVIPFILVICCLIFIRFDKELALSLCLIIGIQLFFALMGRPGREYVYYGGFLLFLFKSLSHLKDSGRKELIGFAIACVMVVPVWKTYQRISNYNDIQNKELPKFFSTIKSYNKPLFVWGGELGPIMYPMFPDESFEDIPIVSLIKFSGIKRYKENYDFNYFKKSLMNNGILLGDHKIHPVKINMLKTYCQEHFGEGRRLQVEDLSTKSVNLFHLKCIKERS